jgi:hypothetical protein
MECNEDTEGMFSAINKLIGESKYLTCYIVPQWNLRNNMNPYYEDYLLYPRKQQHGLYSWGNPEHKQKIRQKRASTTATKLFSPKN